MHSSVPIVEAIIWIGMNRVESPRPSLNQKLFEIISIEDIPVEHHYLETELCIIEVHDFIARMT